MKENRSRCKKKMFIKFLICVIAVCVAFFSGYKTALAISLDIRMEIEPVMLSVPQIMQEPELPNGCEATSMSMVMQYHGVNVDPLCFALEYVPRADFTYSDDRRIGPDPEEYYIGDPTSERGGWYCFEQPIVEGANRYLSESGSELRAKDITGISALQLWKYLHQGQPIVVWMTTDYHQPTYHTNFMWTFANGEQYIPYNNLHCVVLVGMDKDAFYIADPLQGAISVSKEDFLSVYEAMGKRAVVLESDQT